MNELYEKSLHKLELDKVLALLADQACSPAGKEQCLKIEPLTDADEIRLLQKQTSAACRMITLKGSPGLAGVSDVGASVDRAVRGGCLSPDELLRVAGVLKCARQAKAYADGDGMENDLNIFFAQITPNKYLEERIFTSIVSKDEIADAASPELASIRRKIRRQSVAIREGLQKIITSPTYAKFLQEPIVTIRSDRFVVPVKAECKGSIPGLVHDVSSSGSTFFIEPMQAVNGNNALRELFVEERKEIERILTELSGEVAGHREHLAVNYTVLTQLDCIFARAKLSFAMHAAEPEIRTDGKIELKRARHPLITGKTVVPISVRLGSDFDTLIITGPNTGGKTVSLKTAGLLNAMAQYGFLIPAHESSVVCNFREYLVDIGDEQSIEQSLSTFSGHMKRISGILELAGHGTLTLLDELGAGTDPAEGAALAVSILEQLRRQGSLLMATTHYAEMKVYALETPGVVNASCEFNVETLMPTYKLSVGVPGKSNAFLISSKLGIPQNIIDAARSHMSNDDKRLDSVLAQLDDLKLQLKVAQGDAEKARYEAEHALESAEKKRDELIKKGEQELEDARRRAHDLMQNVQNEAYALTDELRRIQKDEKTSAAQRAVRAREIARKDTETLLKKTDSKPKPAREFVPLKEVQIGQEVLIAELNQLATVTARPDRNGMVEVRAGIMKTKVPLSGLCVPDKMDKRPAREPRRSSTRVQLDKSRKASMEINLLGYTVDEALAEVDKFLDSGMLRGQQTLYIIHGNGTGALRTAIQKHLRSPKAVKSFRPGRYGEGENGVTVVELK